MNSLLRYHLNISLFLPTFVPVHTASLVRKATLVLSTDQYPTPLFKARPSHIPVKPIKPSLITTGQGGLLSGPPLITYCLKPDHSLST